MMIDFHCLPMAERLVMLEGSAFNSAFEALDVKNLAPTVCAYVKRMQTHPLFSRYVARQEMWNAHVERQVAKPPGEKAQLSVEYLTHRD
jgi:hypothetical protein